MSSTASRGSSAEHAALINEQFTRQAADFAAAPALHNEAVLQLMIDAASPRPTDIVIDIACGPGSVALAFAPRVARVEGIDSTGAMLDEARSATQARAVNNVNWRIGSAYDLPYGDHSVDIVVSRFALHHFQDPQAAFGEMVRVAAPTGRIVLCDAVASDDPAKARAFNEMERWRDPSTVEFHTLSHLLELFRSFGLEATVHSRFQVPCLAHEFVARAFPARGDRAGLLAFIEQSVEGDLLGMQAKRTNEGVQIAFQAVVLTAPKT